MEKSHLYKKALKGRIIGFGTSLLLTLLAYFIMLRPDFFHLKAGVDVTVILILACLQAAVQLIFFINLWSEKKAFWNIGVFISTISIIFVIVAFSIWIMNNLDYRMMPH